MNKRGNSTKLHLQPGTELDYEQDGLIRGTMVLEGDAAHAGTAPQIGDPHPYEPKAFCYGRKVTLLTLARVRIVCSYIGVSKDPTDFIIEGLGSMSREPIETHRRFVSTIGGTAAAPLHGAKFDPDTKAFIGFPPDAPEHLGGVESYMNPGLSIRRSYWTKRVPDLREMGTIVDVPSTIRVPSNVVNMLVGPTTYRNVGPPDRALYQVSEELIGSGPDGINTLIYPITGA